MGALFLANRSLDLAACNRCQDHGVCLDGIDGYLCDASDKGTFPLFFFVVVNLMSFIIIRNGQDSLKHYLITYC